MKEQRHCRGKMKKHSGYRSCGKLSNDHRQPMLDQLVHFLDLLTFSWLRVFEASEWTIIPWKFKEKAFTFIICRFCNRCTFKKLQWFSATGAQLWALSSVPAQFCGISLSSVVLIFMSAKWQNDAPGWGFGLTRWQSTLTQCLVYNHEMLHILALVGCVKAHRVKTSLLSLWKKCDTLTRKCPHITHNILENRRGNG